MFVDRQGGFSLIEMLIALAVSSVLLAAVNNVFISQRKTYAIREQVAEMQQDVRGGLDLMARELTMAGYDPTECDCAGFVTATATTVQFTSDVTDNTGVGDPDGDVGDADENVMYGLYDDAGDGDQDLGRDTGGGYELVAENIQNLALVYTLDDGTTTAAPADLSRIRAIDVSLTVRTDKPDPQYATNGGYRSITLNTTIQVRNLGL
jgi:type IV pilus assembly protein PilW